MRDGLHIPEVWDLAIQILNGAIILSLGVFMGSLQNLPHPSNYIFFLIVYTGYQIWSAISMESNFGMNIANATVALVGLVFLSINLFANDPLLKDCQSSQPQGLCIYKEASSSVCL
ncbi:membrane-spanning 4-domains subfamily A member 3 [Delphinus delphis]|uniref:membrane-spanning 4-domains subfamily A member 3 n=1 Tax=Delphinus delphis TaxID=9728 RepID=UPI0028C4E1F7|nr:membrane-spanning 4-domains subfamily A member 3 [Delphinus delphis]